MHLSKSSPCIINGRNCPFCKKNFKSPFYLTEHVKLHGPDRFTCSFCGVKMPSHRAITHHIRVDHKISNLNFVPVQARFNDIERDEFNVFEKHIIKSIRYICEHCSLIDNNKKKMESHMKNIHNINYGQCNISIINTSNNSDTEEHIIKMPSAADSIIPQNKIGIKRKNIDDYPNVSKYFFLQCCKLR